jgi:3-hydroxybutyryl-CoA dehydrogenase
MKKIVVIGMGTIGKSITLAFAQNCYDVFVLTRRGKKGFTDLCRYIDKAVEKKRVQTSKSEILARISWINKLSKIPCDAELVIEAIEEDLHKKQKLFQKIDAICSPGTILSSNTSSLSITEISTFMRRPERMIGVHFFNPAQVMKLVELIPGEKTSEKTTRRAKTLLHELGKTPLVVPDQTGFIVNRLLFIMINEAIKALGEGKITAEDIDIAVELGLNHPLGPLRLADFVGLDVCSTILENLYHKTGNSQYKPHPLLVQKVKNNNLGRKTGKGFFDYSSPAKNVKAG